MVCAVRQQPKIVMPGAPPTETVSVANGRISCLNGRRGALRTPS
jgi:hypothetical protein